MFRFSMGQDVVIVVSGERGEVIGQAHFKDGTDQFLVRYKCADGRAVETWWHASALNSAE